MANVYEIIVHKDTLIVEKYAVTNEAAQITITPKSGERYELLDPNTGFAPQQVLFKRDGDNLELHFGDDAADSNADVIIEGYYTLSIIPKFFGLAEDGDYYFFVPQTGLTEDFLEKLDDDDETHQSLGYEDIESGVMWWPLALGGAALAAVALSGGSGDDNVIIPTGEDDEAPTVTFNDLITNDKNPIEFDHDCREGICGTCSLVINGEESTISENSQLKETSNAGESYCKGLSMGVSR